MLGPADASLLVRRNDPDDPRCGELLCDDPHAARIHLFGWPDDEGIRLNGGRPGAALAPDRIRRYFYKMTPAMELGAEGWPKVHDRGSLVLEGPLDARHQAARDLTRDAYRDGKGVITLGGGHDYGFPDAAAFLETHQEKTPLVVNFDAHLDVRPADGAFHSGTPFRRLLEEFAGRVHVLEIGLQTQCNSAAHARWARQNGASLWMADDCRDGLRERIRDLIRAHKTRAIFLSLDIDAVSSDSAPGCSAPSPIGLSGVLVREAVAEFLATGNVEGLGIYEVSPPLDADDRTSRLAALFVHQFISSRGRDG